MLWMQKGFLVVIGAILAVAATVAVKEPLREPLNSPFPRAQVLAAAPMSSRSSAKCRTPPPAVRDILTVSKFGADRRAHGSTVIDPEAEAEYEASTEALTDFTRYVTQLTNGFSKLNTSGARDARCALSWMNSWAEQDGLLGQVNEAGVAVRKWELASLSAAYLKIRNVPADPAQSARVRRWLGRVGAAVKADYSRNLKVDSRSNNHLNWAAWAVMAAAVASEDHELFDWSIDRFRYALAQIEDDGTLPLELKRRQLALSYHNYALGPLIMLREGALANGVALTLKEQDKLSKLVGVVITGLGNPEYLERKAGSAQDLKKFSPESLAWLEPYYARSRDPRAVPLLQRYRPLSYTRLGGNLTELFGESNAPAARPSSAASRSRAPDEPAVTATAGSPEGRDLKR